jgi:6-pyruvoyltetrahydropterin/6-carboxytetrahydropterin synthase
MRITRKYEFSASHRLHAASLSAEENQRLFGKCNNPYGHGHNYVLHVTVRGQPDPATGMVAPREAIDAAVREAVLPKIDRKDMNCAVPEFSGRVPTTENLALVIGDWLCQEWRRRFAGGEPRLSRLRLEETGRNTFDLDLEQP